MARPRYNKLPDISQIPAPVANAGMYPDPNKINYAGASPTPSAPATPNPLQLYSNAGIQTKPVNGMNIPIDLESLKKGIQAKYNFGDPQLANLYKSPLYNQESFLNGIENQNRNYGSNVINKTQSFLPKIKTSMPEVPVSNTQPLQETVTAQQVTPKKSFGSKVGSFLNNPITRGALVAAVVGATGGGALPALTYGLSTGTKFAQNKQENEFNQQIANEYGIKTNGMVTGDQIKRLAEVQKYKMDAKSQTLKDIEMQYDILKKQAESPYYDVNSKAEAMQKMASLEKTYQDIQTGKVNLKYAEPKAQAEVRKANAEASYYEDTKPKLDDLSIENTKSLINSRKQNDSRKANYEQFKIETDLRDALEKNVNIKAHRELSAWKSKVDNVYKDYLKNPEKSRATLDQVLINAVNKVLDPQSVVREGEYARTEQGQSAITQLNSIGTRVVKGGAKLDDRSRQDIVNTINLLYSGSVNAVNPIVKAYQKRSSDYGVRPDTVLGDFYNNNPKSNNVNNTNSKRQTLNQIPDAAITYLSTHPNLRNDFDAKYGVGSARKILGY